MGTYSDYVRQQKIDLHNMVESAGWAIRGCYEDKEFLMLVFDSGRNPDIWEKICKYIEVDDMSTEMYQGSYPYSRCLIPWDVFDKIYLNYLKDI